MPRYEDGTRIGDGTWEEWIEDKSSFDDESPPTNITLYYTGLTPSYGLGAHEVKGKLLQTG